MKSPYFAGITPKDYGKFIVISLGTGSAKEEGTYNAKDRAECGSLQWVYHNGKTPLIDAFSHASSALVDANLSVFFETLNSYENYLRIQVGNDLLKSQVGEVDVTTGIYQPADYHEIKKEALMKFAKKLFDKRKQRMAKITSK